MRRYHDARSHLIRFPFNLPLLWEEPACTLQLAYTFWLPHLRTKYRGMIPSVKHSRDRKLVCEIVLYACQRLT